MFTAVIIDDEPRTREVIQKMLSVYCPNITIVAQGDSVETGFQAITSTKPDVVFLDIKLSDGTGFDLLKRFGKIEFYFFIITAYEEYAVQAFKFSALDYLLKPIDSADLIEAVEKLAKTINIEETNRRFELLMNNFESPDQQSKKIVLKTHENIYVVQVKDIIRCESINNSTRFFIVNHGKVMVSKTLKEFEELLSPLGFTRCHQSHLINNSYIASYQKFPKLQLKLKDGSVIPVSFRKKSVFEEIKGQAT